MVTEVRCSGLARPMVCAGSLYFENLPQEETGAPAKEGTAAGEYLAKLFGHQTAGSSSSHASNGVQFDSDMIFYMKELFENIKSRASTAVSCEQRIDWQTRSGIWIRGSYDVSYIDADSYLCIDDLKYGWSLVEVKPNWQVIAYAIGELRRLQGQSIRGIKLRILQPRPHHEDGPLREWVLTLEELITWQEAIEQRMLQIARGLNDLVTSKSCKYCPAAAVCPALNRAMYMGIESIEKFLQDDIDNKALSEQLNLIDRIEDVIKIRKGSLQTLAVDRIKHGKLIPGWVSEQSLSDRKWKSSVNPEMMKMLTGKDITEKVMLSPAKVEKLGVSKDFVNSLVDRHFLGNKLVKKTGAEIGDKIFGKDAPTRKV